MKTFKVTYWSDSGPQISTTEAFDWADIANKIISGIALKNGLCVYYYQIMEIEIIASETD